MDRRESYFAGSAAPIARVERRRRGSTLAEIAIWIVADTAPGRSGAPAVGTFLLDDRGSLRRDDDEAAALDCATVIVGWDLRSDNDEAVVLDCVISSEPSPENPGLHKIKLKPATTRNFSSSLATRNFPPLSLCFLS